MDPTWLLGSCLGVPGVSHVLDTLVPQSSSYHQNGQHSCRATGQHEQADELLERCLYALEMALHPYCVLGDASCRIPYESEKNRPLFTALFKHMQVCSQLANTRWLH